MRYPCLVDACVLLLGLMFNVQVGFDVYNDFFRFVLVFLLFFYISTTVTLSRAFSFCRHPAHSPCAATPAASTSHPPPRCLSEDTASKSLAGARTMPPSCRIGLLPTAGQRLGECKAFSTFCAATTRAALKRIPFGACRSCELPKMRARLSHLPLSRAQIRFM